MVCLINIKIKKEDFVMTFKEFTDGLNPSPVAYTAYQGYYFLFGDLPDIPKGFKLYSAKYDIEDVSDVVSILNKLKVENKAIDKLDKNSKEYETRCFFVQLQFSEIFDFFFFKHKVYENKLYLVDMIVVTFWDYLKGKISYKRLMKDLNKYNQEYIKD